MNTRAQAKARAAHRSREEGGTIFIVAMTLAVLAALGAFALQSASMEIKTAGYERQSTQTHYLAEYGVMGAMQNMNATTAETYVGLMMNQPGSCTSNAGQAYVSGATKVGKACMYIPDVDMGKAWPQLPSSQTPLAAWGGTATTPGSLGIIPVKGIFYTEMTEPTQAPMVAGNDLQNGFCPVQVTVSSYGVTQPSNTGSNTVAMYAREGLEVARARIVGGPIQWSGCGGK